MPRLIESLSGLVVGLAVGLVADLTLVTIAQAQTTVPDKNPPAPAPVELSLYIAEQCQPLAQGARCRLGFVQVPIGRQPTGNISQTCAPGWLVHVTAERGTVERGGVNRGAAAACGHADAQAAIRQALTSCDEQTFGICQDADHIDIQWAYWSGADDALNALAMNAPLPIEQLPQARQCTSVVPLVESASCPPAAAVLLRQSGLR
jgi:hypothetical protein